MQRHVRTIERQLKHGRFDIPAIVRYIAFQMLWSNFAMTNLSISTFGLRSY